jgi:hypothetical protein
MEISPVEKEGQATYTELFGPLLDQAALMGVLDHLYHCNISVLKVECVPTPDR